MIQQMYKESIGFEETTKNIQNYSNNTEQILLLPEKAAFGLKPCQWYDHGTHCVMALSPKEIKKEYGITTKKYHCPNEKCVMGDTNLKQLSIMQGK